MAQHWLLKLLDGSKDVVVRAKKKGSNRKRAKRAKDKPQKPKPITDEAEKDGTWNDIVDDINLARVGDIDVDEVMQYGLLSVEDGSMKGKLGSIRSVVSIFDSCYESYGFKCLKFTPSFACATDFIL